MKYSLHMMGTQEELRSVLDILSQQGKRVRGTAVVELPKMRHKKRREASKVQYPKIHMKWRRNENAYIRGAVGTTSLEDMSKTLQRTPKSVYLRIQKLNLLAKFRKAQKTKTEDSMPAVIQRVRKTKVCGRGRIWTYAEDQQLRQFHGKMSNGDIAKRMDRTRSSVEQRAFWMGLTKKHQKSKQVQHETRQADVAGQGQVQ